MAMFNVQWIKLIHRYLTLDACKTHMHGLVVLHLDYANFLLYRVPHCEINKIQSENLDAKFILSRSEYNSYSQCLINLHWLPIQQRNWVQNSYACVQQPGSPCTPVSPRTFKREKKPGDKDSTHNQPTRCYTYQLSKEKLLQTEHLVLQAQNCGTLNLHQ